MLIVKRLCKNWANLTKLCTFNFKILYIYFHEKVTETLQLAHFHITSENIYMRSKFCWIMHIFIQKPSICFFFFFLLKCTWIFFFTKFYLLLRRKKYTFIQSRDVPTLEMIVFFCVCVCWYWTSLQMSPTPSNVCV